MRNSKVDLGAVWLSAAGGDADARRDLFSAVRAIALGVGRRFGGSARAYGQDPESFAEDLASDVVVKLLAGSLAAYRGTGSLQGFVRVTSQRLALNQLRTLKRRRIVGCGRPVNPTDGDDGDEGGNPIEQIAGPTVDLDLSLDLQRAQEAFTAHGPAARKCLDAYLAKVRDGYSHREIAQRSAVRRETVTRRIKAAQRGLRKALQVSPASGWARELAPGTRAITGRLVNSGKAVQEMALVGVAA